jgi:hypothetical protein
LLELPRDFIEAHFEEKNQLLGVGDCIILDIGKHVLLRTLRVTRCGLVIPMIPYPGYIAQPRDYLTYFEPMIDFLKQFKESWVKKSLQC